MNRIATALLVSIWLVGCTSPGGRSDTTPSTTIRSEVTTSPSASIPAASNATEETFATRASNAPFAQATPRSPTTDLPVDPSLKAVSLSKPSAGAAEALEICQVLDLYGADKVSGMAMISHARDVVHYAAFTGREPEISLDDPAWVVTFRGSLPQPMLGEVWIDPTCVVIGHDGGLFATGPVEKGDAGTIVNRPANAQKPDRALPPLAP